MLVVEVPNLQKQNNVFMLSSCLKVPVCLPADKSTPNFVCKYQAVLFRIGIVIEGSSQLILSFYL